MNDGIPRLLISGKLPRKNLQWETAREYFEIGQDRYILPVAGDPSPYLTKALQGATIVPRGAWFVTIPEPVEGGIVDSEQPYVESDRSIERKKPWDKIHFEGEVESQFLFGTALGRDIIPFALLNVRPVILPVVIGRGNKVKLLDSETALRNGSPALAAWLVNVERTWDKLKKKGSKLDIYERINFHHLLISQLPKAANRVIFTAAGTHLVSALITQPALAAEIQNVQLRGFVVEHKFYSISASDLAEASYLVAVLNSPLVDKAIKPHQTVGLFGARDIERRALEVLPIPVYDASNKVHQELAELGRRGQEAAYKLLPNLKTLRTGRQRSFVRQALKEILDEIDCSVSKLVGAKEAVKTGYKAIKGQVSLDL